MKQKNFLNIAMLFVFAMITHFSFGQTTIVSNGFEGSDTWTISSGSPSINSSVGASDTPSNSRIKSGTQSWIINNTTQTTEFTSQTITGKTDVKILIYLSSTAGTSFNGADASDYIKVWANVDGAGFPATADIEINGASNARWAYSASLTATTAAGIDITHAAPQSGTNANNYATLEITIPDGSSSLALKVEGKNNSGNEFWNIDDITLIGEVASTDPTVTFDATTSTVNETDIDVVTAGIPVTFSNYTADATITPTVNASSTADATDYTIDLTPLTFTADGTLNIPLTIKEDADFLDETIIIDFTVTSGTATLGTSQHTITITDDETPPVPSLIITEVADPKDRYQGRFVEIYNNGATAINLDTEQIYFVKSVNSGSSFPETPLTGTIEPNTVFIIAPSAAFSGEYGFTSDISFSDANGNGDDAYYLYYGGGRTSGTVLDAYGVLGLDGTNEDWKYEDTRAYRNSPKSASPNATWTLGEWTVESTNKNLLDMTPGALENEFRYDGDWKPRDVYTNSSATDDIYISSSVTLTDNLSVTNFDIETDQIATINSEGSLIVSGTSSGNVTYNRNLANINWYLVSSPVTGETYDDAYVTANSIASGTQNPNSRGIAPFVTTDDSWDYMQAGETTSFSTGTGYSVKRTSTGDVSFTGTINVDDAGIDVVLSSAGNRFNLLGNPYTSHIASATFLTGEAAISETKNLWVWNQGTGTSGAYEVKTVPDAMVIAPAQGFFVQANEAGGTFNFTESNQASNGGTFQRTDTRPEIYLTISDQTDAREAKIYYIENMTSGFDVGYEGGLFNGVSNPLAIYTHLVADSEGKNYQVQSLPTNNYENMIIPVGINAVSGIAISIDASTNNFPDGINIYLEDKQDNSFTLLDADSSFNTTLENDLSGIGRFFLYTTAGTLSTDALEIHNNVSIYKTSNDNLRIVGVQNGTASIQIYNILGKQMMRTSFEGMGVNDISLPTLTNGVYIIKLATKTGTTNKKIIIQ